MNTSGEINGSNGINIVEKCLIVTLPNAIDNDIIESIKNNLLEKVSRNKLNGVIFDFSSLTIMDSYEFTEFIQLSRMIKLFGVPTLFVGLQPGIVSALVDLNIDTDELLTFLNLEHGLNFLRKENSIQAEDEEAEDNINSETEGTMMNDE